MKAPSCLSLADKNTVSRSLGSFVIKISKLWKTLPTINRQVGDIPGKQSSAIISLQASSPLLGCRPSTTELKSPASSNWELCSLAQTGCQAGFHFDHIVWVLVSPCPWLWPLQFLWGKERAPLNKGNSS